MMCFGPRIEARREILLPVSFAGMLVGASRGGAFVWGCVLFRCIRLGLTVWEALWLDFSVALMAS
jgi:hypothetical protein